MIFSSVKPILIVVNREITTHHYLKINKRINFNRICFFLSFPFEWKSPIGFFFAYLMEGIFFIWLFEIAVFPLFIYIGICQYSMTFISDVIMNLEDIRDKYNQSTKTHMTHDILIELHEKFHDVIKFHTEAVQLSVTVTVCFSFNHLKKCFFHSFTLSFSDYYKAILFAFFSVGIIFTCSGLLYMQYVSKFFFLS